MASIAAFRHDNSKHLSWDAALRAFRDHLEMAGSAPATITSYTSCARLFGQWCGELRTPAGATTEQAEAWLADLAASGAKPATLRQRRHAIGAFLRWVDAGAVIPSMPSSPPEPPLLATAPVDVARLLATISGRVAARDRALVALVVGGGWSCASVARMRLSEFGGAGRGAVIARRAIDKDAMKAIDAFARSLRREGVAGMMSPWAGRQGPLGEDGIRRAVRRRLAAADIQSRLVDARRSSARSGPRVEPVTDTAAVAPAESPLREEGLVLVCAPAGEAERLAAAVRALGSSPVVVGSGALAVQVFRARPRRFARVIVSGAIEGADETAAECNGVSAGVAKVV